MHEEFSRSSTEAEYRDLASTATELIWLHYGFRDLDIHIKDPQLLNCYNMSATYLAANPVFHARTRDRFPLCFATWGQGLNNRYQTTSTHSIGSSFESVKSDSFEHRKQTRERSYMQLQKERRELTSNSYLA